MKIISLINMNKMMMLTTFTKPILILGRRATSFLYSWLTTSPWLNITSQPGPACVHQMKILSSADDQMVILSSDDDWSVGLNHLQIESPTHFVESCFIKFCQLRYVAEHLWESHRHCCHHHDDDLTRWSKKGAEWAPLRITSWWMYNGRWYSGSNGVNCL